MSPADAESPALPEAFDIALAIGASNFAERESVVATKPSAAQSSTNPDLDPVDRWRIDRAVERLTASLAHRPGDPPSADRIRSVLTRFHEYEPSALPAPVGARLRAVHDEWLPTYVAALSAPVSLPADRWWTGPDVYFGRLAIVLEPFLRWLAVCLHGRGDAFLRAAEETLLDRLALAVSWAMEVEGKVCVAGGGIGRAATSPPDRHAFLREHVADPPARHAFFLRYPVLGRWAALLAAQLVTQTSLLADRLDTDADLIARDLLGQPFVRVAAVRPGKGDAHNEGGAVAMVDLDTAGGGRVEIVYKPRCIQAEAGLQEVLRDLDARGVVGFATRRVLPRDGYGWEQRLPTDRNVVADRDGARQVYRELGGQLALCYVLGGSDLHRENVIVVDGHAHVCDAETVLRVVRRGEKRPIGGLLDSVFGTGMLEWPDTPDHAATSEAEPTRMRLSGYRGGESYELPVAVPRLVDEDGPTASVRYRTGVRVTPSGANRVRDDHGFVPPHEHAGDVVDGFDEVYRWLQDEPDQAVAMLRRAFAGSRVRFLNWSTQTYAELLTATSHPRATMDPLECDLTFGRLWALPSKHALDRTLVPHEIAALWRRDIPMFGADAEGGELLGGHDDPMDTPLAASPIDVALDRVGELSPTNRAQQVAYIGVSLATDPDHDGFRSACVDHAAQIGDRLCRMLDPDPSRPPWRMVQQVFGRELATDIGPDLYLGTAGVAMFLAHLDAARPDPRVHQAARRALRHARQAPAAGIGAFTGTAGTIYALAHLARLWNEPALRDDAAALARALQPEIAHDRTFDVLDGSAGLIAVMLALADGTDGAAGAGLDVAESCAEHLLRHGQWQDDSVSWAPNGDDVAHANLTGLAHGAGGIGWALIALGATVGRRDLVDVGRAAFRYEARHYDPEHHDWYDLRILAGPADHTGKHFGNAWCNGAPGIGLTRIAAWELTGRQDDRLRDEAHLAVAATTRGFGRVGNDSLCHGRNGNAQFLVRFARLCDDHAWRTEAHLQAQEQWRTFDEMSAGGNEAVSSFAPGLMIGVSGIGLHMLHLADPEHVPSVLLLDPPRP